MGRILTAVLAVTASICLLFSKETNGLRCRSGFNTSAYNIPIQFWDESTECSTSSEQSCFLGELSFDVSFLSEELSFNYGSCLSKAYQTTLECENLIGSNPSFDLDQISLLIPDLEEQFSGAINKFSDDAAKEIINILQNENGQFDNAKIIESLLNALNVTAPDNTKQVITKLDSLILTLIVNASQAGKAADEFLASFSSLGTSDTAASSLLYNLFNTINVTAPSSFKPMIDNLPGFVLQYIKSDQNFAVLNATLYKLISSIDTTNPQNTATAISEILILSVPAEFRLIPLFKSVPSLVNELMNKNFDYINTWQLNLLVTYSRNTSATHALSSSIFNMLKRIGVYDQVPEEVKTVITYQPGYIYNFVSDISDLEAVYYSIADVLNSIDPSAGVDIEQILQSMNLGIELPNQLTSVLNGFIQVSMTGNVTALAEYSLESLKQSSTVTPEILAMSASITTFLNKFNVTLPSEVEDVIRYGSGLLIAAFPNDTALVNAVFLNVSQNLDNIDLTNAGAVGGIDLSSTLHSSLAPLLTLDLRAEVKNFLQQLPSLINMSDPVGSLTKLIELSKTIIPPYLDTIIPVLNTLPDVFTQIMQGNFEYLNTWQLELLKSVSQITPATENLSNAIFNMTKRFGIYDNLTDDMKTLIMYQPGYFYMFLDEQTDVFNMILGNITAAVDSIDPTPSIDLKSILSMVSPTVEFPAMENIISMLEGFFKVAMTGNVEAIGTYGLEALKNSSVLTTESSLLSDSILNFISRLNVSLQAPMGEIITYFPGIFIAAFPEKVTVINNIYVNISQGLDNADISDNPDISNMIETAIQQLQMTGVTFPPEVQSLLNELGPKVNFNDPVGTYEAFLEIANVILLPYDNATLPLLNAVPDLLRQLELGNFSYINTWQVNLLKLYSTTTEATMALSNSIFEMLRRFGVYDQLSEEYITLITYQPGYFYQFFPDKVHLIDMVYYNISAVIDDIGTRTTPDLQELLKRIDGSIDLTGIDPLLDSFEKILNAASTGNVSTILTKTIELLKNISRVTTNSFQLSSTVIGMIENIMNSSLPSGVSDIITYVPGVWTALFPEQTGLIDMIYQRMSQSIQDSLSGTVNVEQAIGDAVTQLEMANITLPAEIMILFDNLPSLIDATISNNETAIDAWFTTVLPLISPIGTTKSAELSNAFRHLVYQIEGVPQSEGLDAIIEYLPRMPYQAFSEQTGVLNTVYTSIADALSKINLTSPEINFGNIFGNIDTSMLPPELIPFLDSAQSLITAAMTNNETLWMEWLNTIQSQYCESNTVTVDFGKAFFEQMNQFDTKMPASMTPALECIPGTMYKFFPNETDMLDDVFGQMIMSVSDYSEYLASQFKRINQTIPTDLAIFVEKWQELQPALVRGNFSEVLAVLTQMNNQMARETELSKLIETVLGKYGVKVTDEMKMYIRQSTVQIYNPALSKYIPTFNAIFSSLNSDVADGTDIGVAIKNAFAGVNIEMYDRIVPVLDNLQSLIDGIVAEDGAMINQAILDIMVSYNASFTSDQTQYAIYQYRLQLLLMNLKTPNIPDEAFEYVGEMYQLMLKIFGTSEDDLKEMLLQTFPDGEAFIQIFFTFDPKEAFSIGTNFITWLAEPNRNSTSLANHIKSAIDILLTRYNIDVQSVLSTISKPKSCKYGVCDTEGCNVYDLIRDVEPVTPVPAETTAPTSTPELTTTTATVVTIPTVAVTTPPVTTTSGEVISSTKTISWTVYLASAILAARWVAS